MTDKERLEAIKDKITKVCINKLPAFEKRWDGKIDYHPYKREDLLRWSKEAFERGESYFYTSPVNPDHPYCPLKLSEPIYKYHIELNQDDYDKIFGEGESDHE